MSLPVLALAACSLLSADAKPAEIPAPFRAAPDSIPELYEGVGDGLHARLRFFFEVTFMKIDIAWVEAYLDPATASVVERMAGEKYTSGRARALEMALLDGSPMLLRMELARGGGAGRFIGATRDNLEGAVECGSMNRDTFDRVWPRVDELLAPIEARGMEKGDAIHYRVDEDRVRIVYLDPAGKLLVDGTVEGREAARGFVGSFMCRETAFSENLIKSAWDDETD